mmetsp:Transcript_10256/g.28644  ORF Transcript_10256/g.28644 Transcript_10256/m.28644 type:complete len:255 (-) Transcript_10256:47-811(-)
MGMSRPASASVWQSQQRPASAGAVLNLNRVVHSAPSWTMRGRSPSRSSLPSTPGPGHYSETRPEKNWCRQQPAYSIGRQARRQPAPGARAGRQQPASPGPGEYEPQEQGTSGPRWAFGGPRPEEGQRPTTPGPAHYETRNCKVSMRRSTSASFSRSQRLAASGRSEPDGVGPGQYYACDCAARRAAPTWRFGTAARGSSPRPCRRGPGPGDYQASSAGLRCKPRYSLGARRGPCGGTTRTDVPAEGGIMYTQFA